LTKAVALVCSEVKGKLTGMAFRVPTPMVAPRLFDATQ
jgi:glyceraldehyde 3-phosphate dehydrogenase